VFRITQEIDFCYGHRLLDYGGKCRHLHGHNGRAVIVLEGPELDRCGMLTDFSVIKSKLHEWIDGNLDHRMILRRDDPAVELLNSLGEPLYLLEQNPTAENIARLIFETSRNLSFPVVEVALWETRRSCATYREGSAGHATFATE
jgi:6-pyruvoyltetrahydropterin/6-carboxytetrahydropterin synthase